LSINGIKVEDINAPDSIALPGDMHRPSPKGTITDTLKALSKVTVTGELRDIKGKKLSDRTGVLYPTVFDKMTINTTLGQDPESSPRNFVLQKSVLYRGKAAITNGHFSFSFIVPRDIAYHFDKGRISYYARIGNEDATGWFGDFIVGGINANAPADVNGPEIKLFLNDEQFAYGGMTDENPVLIAVLSDSSGINTVGNGIGHDLTATLNDNTNQSLVLNDYYQADLDSYTGGSVRYPLSKLSEGPNNLRFKAWDVYNNSSEAYTEFIVSKSAEMSLMHVLNYPNPFTTHTSFMFEHNQVCSDLDVEIRIFTVSGKLIKTIHRPLNISGFLVGPGEITWDGRDDYGSKIGRGVYIYKVKVSDKQGKSAEKTEKLVILN